MKLIVHNKQSNPTRYFGHNPTWEKGRQLKSFDSNTYTYNANGIRTSKTVGGVKHTYTLDGTKILRETWGGNTLIPVYDNEDSVCGIVYNTVPYYFLKNLQGDIIAIVDRDAKPVAKYSYDAWGVPTITSDTSGCNIATINPFRYRGYYYDAEIGLYYLQSRYYDPGVCRFVNTDNMEWLCANGKIVETNLFSYCLNDCVNNKDEYGNVSLETITSLLEGIISAVKKIVNWLHQAAKDLLKIYGGLDWKDISAIAKDIERSPHRVRQSIDRILGKLKIVKSKLGKFAIGVAVLSMIATLGKKAVHLQNITKAIAECVVETGISFLESLAEKILKPLLKLIPMVGVALSFLVGTTVKIISKIFLTEDRINAIKNRVTSVIEMTKYTLADYFSVFLKQLA